MKKTLSIISGILLLLALCPWPSGFYTFLRISITVVAVYFAITEAKNSSFIWLFFFGGIAILFNPIIPIYLYKKPYWAPIDFLAGVFFLLYGFQNFKNKKHV